MIAATASADNASGRAGLKTEVLLCKAVDNRNAC